MEIDMVEQGMQDLSSSLLLMSLLLKKGNKQLISIRHRCLIGSFLPFYSC